MTTIDDMVKDTGTLGQVFVDHLNAYCLYEMPMAKEYAEFELNLIKKMYPKHYDVAKHLYDGCINSNNFYTDRFNKRN